MVEKAREGVQAAHLQAAIQGHGAGTDPSAFPDTARNISGACTAGLSQESLAFLKLIRGIFYTYF